MAVLMERDRTMTNSANDITIESAKPIDPETAASLTYSTAPPIVDYMFNGDREVMLGFLSDSWQKPDGIFSHNTCTSATRDGSLLGINIGFTAETLHENAVITMGHAEESLDETTFARFADLMGWFSYLSPPVPEDAFFIFTLAVKDASGNLLSATEAILHAPVF